MTKHYFACQLKDVPSEGRTRFRLNFCNTLMLASGLVMILALGAGCGAVPRPLKPGTFHSERTASTPSQPGYPRSTLDMVERAQPENPAHASTHHSERSVRSVLTLPAGSRVSETTPASAVSNAPMVTRDIVLATGGTQVTEMVERTDVTLGAAQKDLSRELAAKFAGMKPVQVAGLMLVLAALAMFHPTVRAVTQSRTLQAVTGACGLVLIFLPLMVAGHEGWWGAAILGGLGLPLVWFVVHRHGRLHGQLQASQRDRAGQDE